MGSWGWANNMNALPMYREVLFVGKGQTSRPIIIIIIIIIEIVHGVHI